MKKRIKSISEAFSMQPIKLTVTDPEKPSKFNPRQDIKRIELEVMNENTNIYVGYGFEGQKLFQYIAESVNVHYFS